MEHFLHSLKLDPQEVLKETHRKKQTESRLIHIKQNKEAQNE